MMALRMVLIGLVACLGFEMAKEPAAESRCRRDVDGPVVPLEGVALTRATPLLSDIEARDAADSLPAETKPVATKSLAAIWHDRIVALRSGWAIRVEKARAILAEAQTRQREKLAARIGAPKPAPVTAVELVENVGDIAIASDDANFDFVVEQMAQAFAAQQAETKSSLAATTSVERQGPKETLVEADPVGTELSIDVVVEEELVVEEQPVDVAMQKAPQTETPSAEVSPVGRIANALRLTGRACEAWASLLDGSTFDEPTRQSAREQVVR